MITTRHIAGFVIAGAVCGSLGGCASIGTTVLTSVASAAIKTAIEQTQNHRPSAEQLWQDAQLAGLEHRAISGDSQAQYELGTYYLVRRESAGADWICQAAIVGHPQAQLQYGHFFNEDRKQEDLYPFVNIFPNNEQAFVWYSLATRAGEPMAAHFRDSLMSGRMTRAALDRAEGALDAWQPTACGAMQHASLSAATPGPLAAR
jgi:TPR repeat protein